MTTPPNAPEVDVLAPTPMVENRLGIGMDCAYRMDAYYYGFSPTGLDVIDRILSAVACAGEGYHHTEDWNQECSIRHDYQRGTSPAEIIHNAAIDSANLIRTAVEAMITREAALVAENEALKDERDQLNSDYLTAINAANVIAAENKAMRAIPEEIAAGWDGCYYEADPVYGDDNKPMSIGDRIRSSAGRRLRAALARTPAKGDAL